MLPKQLSMELRRRRVLLFVGAGLSATLKLPSWAALIQRMAGQLNFDPDLFQMLGTFPSLAEYYIAQGRTRAELAEWLTEVLHPPGVDIGASKCHASVAKAQFPRIYTTNYDHWLERAHDSCRMKYSKVVHGSDIANTADDETEIVKFHGDVLSPKSIVLTETDYFERLRFEAELDLKLRADLLKYSILFVGYSLSDVNLRSMLYRLATARKAYPTGGTALPQSFIFVDRHNEVQAALLRDWGIETILSEDLDRTRGLENFLRKVEMESKAPA